MKRPRVVTGTESVELSRDEFRKRFLETRRRIAQAQRRQRDRRSPSRVLVINGSARSDQTCPGEMSKAYRLAKIAAEAIESRNGFEVDFLDLSRLTSEYGRVIHPCKACVSTAQPLCRRTSGGSSSIG